MKEKTCPTCGRTVAAYCQFCPDCDTDLPSENAAPAVTEPPAEAAKEDAPEHISQTWTDPEAEKAENLRPTPTQPIQEKPTLPPDGVTVRIDAQKGEAPASEIPPQEPVKVCPRCLLFMPAAFKFCNRCGGALADPKDLADMTGGGSSEGTVGAVVPSSDPATPAVTAPSLDATPLSKRQSWSPQTLPPVILHFKAGKSYYKDAASFLEFRLMANCTTPIESVHLSVETNLMQKILERKAPAPIPPGVARDIEVPGFRPAVEGEDAAQITVVGTARGMESFHLRGSVTVRVMTREKTASSIVFKEGSFNYLSPEAIDKLQQNFAHQPGVEHWVPVSLYWDKERQEREAKFFPAKCVEPSSCALDEVILSSIRSLSPESAPTATISSADGTAHFIIPGNTLLLGRDEDSCHVSLKLSGKEPAAGMTRMLGSHTFSPENQRVSKSHCQIFIRENRVFIRDVSSNGTFVQKRLLARNEDVPLADDEVILFPNNLELQVKIFTDGSDVVAVHLIRLNNKTNHRYVLAHGPVPVGGNRRLPICVPGGRDFCGSLYYHPHLRAWFFRKSESPPDGQHDMRLDGFIELDLGTVKSWFSTS